MPSTLNPTNIRVESNVESPYLFNGFVLVDGVMKPIYIAQEGTSCEDCEWSLSNSRRHPRVEGDLDVHVDCSGYLVRLV